MARIGFLGGEKGRGAVLGGCSESGSVRGVGAGAGGSLRAWLCWVLVGVFGVATRV